MRPLPLLLLLCAPASAAGGGAPEVRVVVGRAQIALDPLTAPEPEKDAADLASFLVVNLQRRDACPRAALPGLHARLLPHLAKAAGEEPTRFHYLTRLAPRFDEDRITDLFAFLSKEPAGFTRYLRSQVRFIVAADAAAGEGKDPSKPDAEVQVSEVALREYRRYQMHCPFIWVEMNDGTKPDPSCGYRTLDFSGLFDSVMKSPEFKPRAP